MGTIGRITQETPGSAWGHQALRGNTRIKREKAKEGNNWSTREPSSEGHTRIRHEVEGY